MLVSGMGTGIRKRVPIVDCGRMGLSLRLFIVAVLKRRTIAYLRAVASTTPSLRSRSIDSIAYELPIIASTADFNKKLSSYSRGV